MSTILLHHSDKTTTPFADAPVEKRRAELGLPEPNLMSGLAQSDYGVLLLLGYKWEEWKLGNFGLLFAIGWC